MLGILIPLAGGLIAASGWIVSRRPGAKELLDKLTPYTGWIGITMFLWGIWEAIHAITGISLISKAPVSYLFWLLMTMCDLSVGFLLGFGLIAKHALSKSDVAMEKGERVRQKLV